MATTYSYKNLADLFEKDLDRIQDFYDIPKDLISLKPEADSWSGCEIIQHINKFNDLYIEQIDLAIESGKNERAKKESFKPRFIFRQFIHFMEPPYKIKVKTIAPMYPNNASDIDPVKTIDRLKERNLDLKNRIDEYRDENFDLDRIKGKNPVISWVSMTLAEFILLLEAHQRRHFWQLEQTLLKLSGNKY